MPHAHITIADQIALAAKWREREERIRDTAPREQLPMAQSRAFEINVCIREMLALQPAASPQAIPAEVLDDLTPYVTEYERDGFNIAAVLEDQEGPRDDDKPKIVGWTVIDMNLGNQLTTEGRWVEAPALDEATDAEDERRFYFPSAASAFAALKETP